MRPPSCVLLFLILGPAFALAVFAGAQAAQSKRAVTFVNAGAEPLYAIRIGHSAAGAWSEDLLGSTDVLDAGEARRLNAELQGTCWYDVRFEYRGAIRVFLR